MKFMYTRYTSVPSGEIAIAGKSGRSEASAALTGADQVAPRLDETCTNACSFGPGLVLDGVGPSHHVTTIRSVAPAPVGAALAMSMLGKLLVRAPATPSNVKRPC